MDTRTVYSTEKGRICPECAQPSGECLCRRRDKSAVPKTDGIVRIRYETKGRKGKGVTVVSGLPLDQNSLEDLSRKLKQRLGAGGSVRGYTIELQGDHRGPVKEELSRAGYNAR